MKILKWTRVFNAIIIITVTGSKEPDHVLLPSTDHQIKLDALRLEYFLYNIYTTKYPYRVTNAITCIIIHIPTYGKHCGVHDME